MSIYSVAIIGLLAFWAGMILAALIIAYIDSR